MFLKIGCEVELTSTAREVISRPGITANKVFFFIITKDYTIYVYH